jgi:hypothetical protein
MPEKLITDLVVGFLVVLFYGGVIWIGLRMGKK